MVSEYKVCRCSSCTDTNFLLQKCAVFSKCGKGIKRERVGCFVGHKNDTWKTNTFVFDWAKRWNKSNMYFLVLLLLCPWLYNNYFIWCTRFNSNEYVFLCCSCYSLFIRDCSAVHHFGAFPRSHLDSSHGSQFWSFAFCRIHRVLLSVLAANVRQWVCTPAASPL